MGRTCCRMDGKSSLRQDFSMKCKGLIVAALLLATPLCAMVERGFVSNSKDVTFSIISPQDGSLWIATESHGLLRLGATGRTFHYSSATGDFPCDSISALAFSSSGTLYMKDARGGVYAYTTLSGFKQQNDIPDDVVFETQKEIKSTETTEQILPTPYRKHPTWPYWLVIFLLSALVAYLLLRKFTLVSKTTQPKVLLEVDAKEDRILPSDPSASQASSKPEETESSQPEEPMEVPQIVPNPDFVARVEGLVAANFSDPAYSVETLADALGITRVHLNRKLKEAGAPAPKMILKKARMEKALTMLREGFPVSDVYTACGFSSASYFSSAFKEYFGYTPSDVIKPNV